MQISLYAIRVGCKPHIENKDLVYQYWLNPLFIIINELGTKALTIFRLTNEQWYSPYPTLSMFMDYTRVRCSKQTDVDDGIRLI